MPKTRIKNIIHTRTKFQYSVNIGYDFNDNSKIRDYLPTSNSLSIIEEILLSTYDTNFENHRARLLTGSYGKGKSHLILSIISLLAGKEKELFTNIINKAKEIRPKLYDNINQYLESGKKLFPVIINASSMDIKSNFLRNLSIALKEANLTTLMPNTFFDVAIEKIQDWRDNFSDTFHNFEKAIGMTGQQFIDMLEEYDKSRYEQFVQVYPTLTSGSTFNPVDGTDFIRVYESVLVELKKVGYSGIFVVYDEFSKFLEGSVNNVSAMDIDLLQKFAERCDRSNGEQLHLLLISHRGIDSYVSKLDKKKVDSWKAVSKRFKNVEMKNNDAEIYEIISQILQKDETAYKAFLLNKKAKIIEIRENIDNGKLGTFEEISKYMGEEFVSKCYPLHPYSLYMLPKISELIAQNERTVFTFLASNERNTANDYLMTNNDDFEIIEPDIIYDYFETLFKGEPHGSIIRKQWNTTAVAISKLEKEDDDLAKKIVKTISLIYIINQFEMLPPSLDIVYEIYGSKHSPESIARSINFIKSCNLLIELQYKPHVRISENSGHDLNKMIREESIAIENSFDYLQTLRDNLFLKYFYPIRYNDENEVIRYFNFDFIKAKDFLNINQIEEAISVYDGDGVILAIVCEEHFQIAKVRKKIESINNNRTVFIMTKKILQLEEHLKKYSAIRTLINKYPCDKLLTEELEYLAFDLYNLINRNIENNYLKPELKRAEYFCKGEQKNVCRKSHFSDLLSEICYEVYCLTPKIVNENINRNRLSSPMKKTRERIISGLLEKDLEENLGLNSSQDINVARSLFCVPGIIKELSNPIVSLENVHKNFTKMIIVIKDFFISTEQEKRLMSELYELLTSPNNNIGLKKGVVSFYIAIVLREYTSRLVFTYKNRELSAGTDLLIQINENPEKYFVQIVGWGAEEELYLARLKPLFSNYFKKDEEMLSSFDAIVKAMQRWYMQLSKYNKATDYYYTNKGVRIEHKAITKRLKRALGNAEINGREFLFDKLPNIFKTNDYPEIARNIETIKYNIDNNRGNIITKTITTIRRLFHCGKNDSTYSGVLNYYEDLNKTTKTHVFSGVGAVFLNSIKTISNDEDKFVCSLIKGLYHLRIEDLNDEMMDSIGSTLKEAKGIIDKYNADSDEGIEHSANGYEIVFIKQDGNRVEKHFAKTELTKVSELLHNDVTTLLDEFGESISKVEKGQVLLEILKELMD